jgi:hypothetical protein
VGYLAKKNTAKKAAAATGPVGFDAGDEAWHTAGRAIAAAIIHEAALDLNLKNKFSDINRAGRKMMVASAVAGALTSVDTMLWIQEVSGRKWHVWLGAATMDGRLSKDWLSEVHVGPNQVQIHTPQYFMKDGTMLKVKLHDQFRTAVFERMAAGSPREPGDALALSRRTCSASGVGDTEVQRIAGTETFGGSSLVPLAQLTKDFVSGTFGFPPLGTGENSWRYGLGLPSAWSQNWAEITFGPGTAANGTGAAISGSITVSPCDVRGPDTMAAAAARFFWNRVSGTLKNADAQVALVPPASFGVA